VSGKNSKSNSNPLIALFAARWPKCFFVYENRRRPLACGIHKDVIATFDGIATEDAIRKAIRYYVGNEKYLKAMTAGAPRIGLDGEPVGFVTEDQAHGTASILKHRHERKKAKAKPPPAKPPPTKRSHAANADKPRLSLKKIGGRA
jgi:ProP effector